MNDLYHNLDIRVAIPSALSTDDTPLVSSIIDLANREGCVFSINVGTIDDANATFVVLVEDGNDSALGDNAAVADAYLHNTEAAAAFTFANDGVVRTIGYHGPKRYVRLTITPSGNSANPTGARIGATAILGTGRKHPLA